MEDAREERETTMRDEIIPLRMQTPVQAKDWPGIERPRTVPRRVSTQSIILDGKEASTDLRLPRMGTEFTYSTQRTASPTQLYLTDHPPPPRLAKSFADLPLEVQRRIVDYISGEMHSVSSTSAYNLSSSMRHPRRKAVSDFALVGTEWRELVQERIYRHIKVKGTRQGLCEAATFFSTHPHLTKHIRHIEVWVPVWGDRTTIDPLVTPNALNNTPLYLGPRPVDALMQDGEDDLVNHEPSLSFCRSIDAATLEEIFGFVSHHLRSTCIFTLEGGHCKKSNMIRQFRNLRFPQSQLPILPRIRTFAMRGAWNIIRSYSDWTLIEAALPNVQEWHCNYAKPRPEAYNLISEVLYTMLPFSTLRHVNISLDGMYSKDTSSPTLASNGCASPNLPPHLCEQLGRLAPYLESISYTGKICSLFWTAAAQSQSDRQRLLTDQSKVCHSLVSSSVTWPDPELRSLDLVVKSCCRPRVVIGIDPISGIPQVEEVGNAMADVGGITNLVFTRAFERLILSTIQNLDRFPLLDSIRIRFIDLDSPCAQLNPYWTLDRRTGKVTGLWSEEILEELRLTQRGRWAGCEYEQLGLGIEVPYCEEGGSEKIDVGGVVNISENGGRRIVYPKSKPKAIKTSAYRVVAEARGS